MFGNGFFTAIVRSSQIRVKARTGGYEPLDKPEERSVEMSEIKVSPYCLIEMDTLARDSVGSGMTDEFEDRRLV